MSRLKWPLALPKMTEELQKMWWLICSSSSSSTIFKGKLKLKLVGFVIVWTGMNKLSFTIILEVKYEKKNTSLLTTGVEGAYSIITGKAECTLMSPFPTITHYNKLRWVPCKNKIAKPKLNLNILETLETFLWHFLGTFLKHPFNFFQIPLKPTKNFI